MSFSVPSSMKPNPRSVIRLIVPSAMILSQYFKLFPAVIGVRNTRAILTTSVFSIRWRLSGFAAPRREAGSVPIAYTPRGPANAD
jgi:hypothetical protein